MTSWTLEQNLLKKSKGKTKEQQNLIKTIPKQGKVLDEKIFPFPWIQIEFKELTYITEILLQTTKGQRPLLYYITL